MSPKGGPAGFVRVLDDQQLLIPDATGNRRLDSFQNILENPCLGLLFMIPGFGETLRVNGRVRLTRDPELLKGLATGGRRRAQIGLVVTVEQAYVHCSRSVVRSRLWDADAWHAAEGLPSEVLTDPVGIRDLAATAAALAESYASRLRARQRARRQRRSQ